MAIRSKKNTAFKVVLDVFDKRKLSEVSYEEGAFHIADNGLYLHYQGEKVLLHPAAELKSTQVLVTESEILDLADTPKTVIPAQGENKVIDPISVTIQRVPGGSSYTSLGNLNFTLNGNAVVSFSSTIINETEGIARGVIKQSNLKADTPLRFTSTGTNPTGGNGDIIVRVLYRLIDIT